MNRISQSFFMIMTILPFLASCTNYDEEIAQLSTVQAYQATQIAGQATMISYLATRGPAQNQEMNPTVTPYRPIQAAVIIEDGRCCAGGMTGETIEVDVVFKAFSPLADVTEMRMLTATIPFEESDMAAAEWQPFVSSKSLPVSVALGWIGYYVSVQYRDSQGNLSPVVHDDISVEGHPPSPTP